jgi:alpha-beta hydrolase superfamily lysophospholipase
LDLRGFGNSKEEGLPKGCVSDFEQHLQDIDDFIVYLRVVHKGKKLFILGHSLGGVYALWYAALHSATIDGLVLAAPPITSAFSNRKNAITISIKNAIIPRRTHNPYTSSNAKNRDPEEIEIMLKDPLETPQLTVNYLANVKNRLLKVALPTLILQGEIDTTVLGTGAKKLYAKLNAKDKKLELFPDAGHWFYDVLSPVSPRAKYTPAKREQFIVVIKAWLKNH